MKIPSIEECEEIILEFGMPENIKLHTNKVRKVANFLAKKIYNNHGNVNLDLVDKAALLHDFTKMYCIENKCSHTIEAGKILKEKGFPEFGEIIKQHGLEEVNSFNEKTCIEAKIVWYADKRVNHDKLVSLGARYLYLKERYGKISEKKMSEIVSTEKNSEEVEEELFGLAGLKRDFLEDDINE